MNRRHFLLAITACAVIPLLPPGKEWARETGWVDLTQPHETRLTQITVYDCYRAPELWSPRMDGGFNVYVMEYDASSGHWNAMIDEWIKPDRVEYYDPLTIKIPDTPAGKE